MRFLSLVSSYRTKMLDRFIVQEIDDIRAGKWDDRIKEELGLRPHPQEVEEEPAPAEEQPPVQVTPVCLLKMNSILRATSRNPSPRFLSYHYQNRRLSRSRSLS